MAHHKSAEKRIRTAEKNRISNRRNRSQLYTVTKAVRQAKSREEGDTALAAALPFLDKMAQKGIIHRNKAARQKSKLTKFVHSL